MQNEKRPMKNKKGKAKNRKFNEKFIKQKIRRLIKYDCLWGSKNQ